MTAEQDGFEYPKPRGLTGWLRANTLDPRALSAIMRNAEPQLLRAQIEPIENGKAELGLRVLGGSYRCGAAELRGLPNVIWKKPPPSLEWAEWMHRFDWLADLAALGDVRADRHAADLAQQWLKQFQEFHPLAWRPDIAARRLWNWLSFAAQIAPTQSGSPEEERLLSSIWTHAEWIEARQDRLPVGVAQVQGAVTMVLAAAMVEGREGIGARAGEALTRAIDGGILPDGGAPSRSPIDTVAIFSLLLNLRRHLLVLEQQPVTALLPTIERVSAAVRFFQMSSGRLPVFHGGDEGAAAQADLLLTRSQTPATLLGALPQSGYLKMQGGRVSVIMDVASAPEGADATRGHASCLGFEMESGRRRMVVNCGSGRLLGGDWTHVGRLSAAHSTLILDDRSCAQSLPDRNDPAGEPAFRGPREVESERSEELNGVWALASHNGYVNHAGIKSTRRLFLSADGGDFRGEDVFEVAPGGERAFRKRLNALPGNQRATGIPFALRFHLHPDVAPELVTDADAVTLRLPHGEIWVMRQSGGRLALEPSVYLGEGRGPRQTQQVVINGGLAETGLAEKSVKIRWALRRVGEISKLPSDAQALLALDPVEAVGFEALDKPPFGI
ncbi:MAG: heparinase II/III family protein [Neomegalonema sp.]|nr:heparinase II/III family protein [Neomegalonema sp.]